MTKTKRGKIELPGKNASLGELSDFFDRHDAVELMDAGITQVDRDHSDIDGMLREYWSQPNSQQVNIRIPAAAKNVIEKLAKRKTLDVSTLVRMWVIDSMRREALQP